MLCKEWGEFAEAVCAKFGREELQKLIRQFNQLKQVGSVASYAEKFNELVHQLHTHHPSWTTVFFITQFIDGLRAKIRAAMVLHHPPDLDTTVEFACLQEEVLESARRDVRQVDQYGLDLVWEEGLELQWLPIRCELPELGA